MRDAEPCAEDETLSDAKTGKTEAFATLVRTHQASIYSLALRVLGDREYARDLAQEVFLQLYRKLSTIESARHLKFWLRKVTVNLAIDRIRQQPRVEFAVLDDNVDSALSLADNSSDSDPVLHEQLLTFVCELPPSPRVVMLLRYQEDLDPTEIAQALDMSINTVKSHLKRSLTVMRERVLAGGLHRGERRLS